MFMVITGIDLFNQNVGMAYANVRHRCLWISLVLIYLIQKVVMTCAEARLRSLWISLVLIYWIKMWIWHVQRLDTDVHGYHWY